MQERGFKVSNISLTATLCLILAAAVAIFVTTRIRSGSSADGITPLGVSDAVDPTLSSHTTDKLLEAAADKLNAKTPMAIDVYTTLERATVSGRALTYHYRLTSSAADESRLRGYIHKDIVPQVCSGPLRKAMQVGGVSYIYSYTGDAFKGAVRVTVNDKTCIEAELATINI